MKDCELFMTMTWKSRNAVEDTQTAVVTARRNTRRETGSDGTENGIWNNGRELEVREYVQLADYYWSETGKDNEA